MRIALLIACLALPMPALAWSFEPRPVCTLRHDAEAGEVTVTYDPRAAVYAIALTRPGAGWPPGPIFEIRFEGVRPLTIGTDRQVIAGDTLTVTDSGFGNVLDGLEFNDTATARIGQSEMRVALAGAAGPVAAFRACATAPSV